MDSPEINEAEPINDKNDDCTLRRKVLRSLFSVAFSLSIFLLLAFSVLYLAVLIGNLSIWSPISVHSRCRIVSSSKWLLFGLYSAYFSSRLVFPVFSFFLVGVDMGWKSEDEVEQIAACAYFLRICWKMRKKIGFQSISSLLSDRCFAGRVWNFSFCLAFFKINQFVLLILHSFHNDMVENCFPLPWLLSSHCEGKPKLYLYVCCSEFNWSKC